MIIFIFIFVSKYKNYLFLANLIFTIFIMKNIIIIYNKNNYLVIHIFFNKIS